MEFKISYFEKSCKSKKKIHFFLILTKLYAQVANNKIARARQRGREREKF